MEVGHFWVDYGLLDIIDMNVGYGLTFSKTKDALDTSQSIFCDFLEISMSNETSCSPDWNSSFSMAFLFLKPYKSYSV